MLPCATRFMQILRMSTNSTSSPLEVLLGMALGMFMGHVEGKDISQVRWHTREHELRLWLLVVGRFRKAVAGANSKSSRSRGMC